MVKSIDPPAENELHRKSLELRERSRQIRARCQEINSKIEDVIKRSNAAQEAGRLVRGNADYILKKCGCGRSYGTEEWFELPFAGYQEHPAISGEMRQCPCHSTLLFITRREAA